MLALYPLNRLVRGVAFTSLLACAQGDPQALDHCRLEKAVEAARSDAVRFDDVAITATGPGALAVWSEPSGTYDRVLNADGKASAPATRIAERCTGGIDLARCAGKVWLACSQPSAQEENAALLVLSLDPQGGVSTTRKVGNVGRDGAGVSVACAGERLFVGYHDGTVQAYAARLAILEGQAQQDILLSDLSFAAGAPSIAARGGHWIAAFSETRVGASQTSTRIVARGDQQAPRTVRETGITDPSPEITWDDDSPWLAYRDRSAKSPKPDLYTVRLSEKLALRGTPQMIGRANSDGPPSVVVCRELRFALLPREYATERYIGVHSLDGVLKNTGAGHQYYTNSRDFVLAAGACVGDSALLLTAERAAPSDPGVSLMALPFRCRT